jgi:hypothetical protein
VQQQQLAILVVEVAQHRDFVGQNVQEFDREEHSDDREERQ